MRQDFQKLLKSFLRMWSARSSLNSLSAEMMASLMALLYLSLTFTLYSFIGPERGYSGAGAAYSAVATSKENKSGGCFPLTNAKYMNYD